MFSAVERTGSYKMWSQVLLAVSRGIYAKVFLDCLAALLAESFGFIVFLFLSDVYIVYVTVTTLSVPVKRS